MLAHSSKAERSNVDGDCCINSNLVNILTKDHGVAVLPNWDIKLQELIKKRK